MTTDPQTDAAARLAAYQSSLSKQERDHAWHIAMIAVLCLGACAALACWLI